jgi:hypothetical protein
MKSYYFKMNGFLKCEILLNWRQESWREPIAEVYEREKNDNSVREIDKSDGYLVVIYSTGIKPNVNIFVCLFVYRRTSNFSAIR